MQRVRKLLTWGLASLVAFAAGAGPSAGQEAAGVVLDMDSAIHRPIPFGKEKMPTGTVEVVEGRFGKACQFRFAENARGGFFVAGVKGGPDWDEAAGISFWVKGDGSASWGGLELIDETSRQLLDNPLAIGVLFILITVFANALL